MMLGLLYEDNYINCQDVSLAFAEHFCNVLSVHSIDKTSTLLEADFLKFYKLGIKYGLIKHKQTLTQRNAKETNMT